MTNEPSPREITCPDAEDERSIHRLIKGAIGQSGRIHSVFDECSSCMMGSVSLDPDLWFLVLSGGLRSCMGKIIYYRFNRYFQGCCDFVGRAGEEGQSLPVGA